MAKKNCIQSCCLPKEQKRELTKPICPFPAGVYENVNIEINEHCQVIRLEKAESHQVRLCDSCA